MGEKYSRQKKKIKTLRKKLEIMKVNCLKI